MAPAGSRLTILSASPCRGMIGSLGTTRFVIQGGSTEGPQTVDGDDSSQHAKPSTSQSIIKTLPMSFGQSGFWFMNQLVGDPTFFNGTVSFLIKTNLDVELLARLVRDMGRRHEGLRTAFFADHSNQPKQGVLAEPPLYLRRRS